VGKLARHLGTVSLVAALLVAFVATDARADDATDKARAEFQDANQHYRLGQFEDALAAYKRAYEQRPLPEFLFNIGQCHFNLGNYERSIFFYESFLREKPDAPNRGVVESQLVEARAALDMEQAAERERLEKERAERETKLQEEERARAEAERARAEEERRLQEERRLAAEAEAEALAARGGEDDVDPWLVWTGVGATAAVLTAAAVGGAVLAISLASAPATVPPAGSIGTIDARTEGAE
jgi:tetratricopeptide (TPR) repeat protein